MLQRFWDCSRLETKGVTAYAAKSAKMPSVLHASMHPDGRMMLTYPTNEKDQATHNPVPFPPSADLEIMTLSL